MPGDSRKALDLFLEQFWQDCDQGGARAREDYLRDFPGIEEAIDSHLAFLERRSAAASQSTGTDGFPRFARQSPCSSDGRLGRYRLISELGKGGQGAVYLAEDERLHRKVALKVLFGGLIHSTEARLRFEREAEATGRLNHPGIAKIYEMDEAMGVPFIAMELIEGETLAQRISTLCGHSEKGIVTEFLVSLNNGDESGAGRISGRTTLSSPQLRRGSGSGSDEKALQSTARFIEATARALHMAHESGLIHRDIKPGNIMVRLDESPCILDFGLVHDESSQGQTITQSGDRFGTPAYMAPEQVRSKTREVDRRTDVWALGAILYECCTLRRPFAAPTHDELFDRIKNEEPVAPRRLNAKIPRDLEAIILRALEKDQFRRYASAEDFAEDLRRFCEHETVSARAVGPLVLSQRWVRRNQRVAATGTIVMLSLIAASIVFFVKGKEARDALQLLNEKGAELSGEVKVRQELQVALQQRRKALEDYNRLADVIRLENAIEEAGTLYPPSPTLVPKLRSWQKKYGSLALSLQSHRALLPELRQKALPYSEEERQRDFATERVKIPKIKAALTELEGSIAVADTKKPLLDRRSRLIKRLDELEQLTTAGRNSWHFEDQALQFQHDVLAKLVHDLEAFSGDENGTLKSVAKCLDQSLAIRSETIGDERATLWLAAQRRISRSEEYSGLDLKPQLGLIPLGPDPESGLEEFLHWLTHEGEVPTRDAKTGKIAITKQLGVVLVLIPGGIFLMGSQKDDPLEANYDPNSQPDEQPVHAVTLAPYFLSKYEMTQAQWCRAFPNEPRRVGADFKAEMASLADDLRPAQRVSWHEAQLLLPLIDLLLPTAAEWERAARSGLADQLFSGCSEIATLSQFANIGDAQPKVVGSYLPNAYGLFDMSGNVFEWCLDGDGDSYTLSPGTRGLRGDPGASFSREIRGGSHLLPANFARVASRDMYTPYRWDGPIGLRPAKLITTE